MVPRNFGISHTIIPLTLSLGGVHEWDDLCY